MRPTDSANAGNGPTDDARGREWTEHEHVSEPVRTAAKRLLESAGSPDIAKHAIDVVQDPPADEAVRARELAERYGFASYEALLSAADQPAADSRRRIVSLPDGRWLAWHQDTLESVVQESRNAADDWLSQGTPQS